MQIKLHKQNSPAKAGLSQAKDRMRAAQRGLDSNCSIFAMNCLSSGFVMLL